MRCFNSKYMSKCANCGEPTHVGDYIAYVSNKEVYHYDCRPEAGEKEAARLNQDGYLFIDTETGGLDPRACALVQIAVIATDNNFLIKEYWSGLIKPPQNLTITERATEVHGWTREKLKHKPPEAEVVREFLEFCLKFPNHRFAGQNAPYDLKFLQASYERNNYDSSIAYLLPPFDTLTIAQQKMRKKVPNCQLGTLAAHFGFDAAAAHDALADLFLTVQVARQLQLVAA